VQAAVINILINLLVGSSTQF